MAKDCCYHEERCVFFDKSWLKGKVGYIFAFGSLDVRHRVNFSHDWLRRPQTVLFDVKNVVQRLFLL